MLSGLTNQPQIKSKVMNGRDLFPQILVRSEQVAEVGPGVRTADLAGAGLVDGRVVEVESGECPAADGVVAAVLDFANHTGEAAWDGVGRGLAADIVIPSRGGSAGCGDAEPPSGTSMKRTRAPAKEAASRSGAHGPVQCPRSGTHPFSSGVWSRIQSPARSRT